MDPIADFLIFVSSVWFGLPTIMPGTVLVVGVLLWIVGARLLAVIIGLVVLFDWTMPK